MGAFKATKRMEQLERFVAILPAGKMFDRVFKEALAPAGKSAEAEIDLIKPDFASEKKLGAICQKLEGARAVVADITARNPHVMYLAGYAQGIGRQVIFIAQHGEDFPFDQNKHPTIIYGSDLEFLKKELVNHLSVSQPGTPATTEGPREKFLSTFGDLLEKHQHEHHGAIVMENPTTFVLMEQDMDLGLVQDLARRGRELGIRIKLM